MQFCLSKPQARQLTAVCKETCSHVSCSAIRRKHLMIVRSTPDAEAASASFAANMELGQPDALLFKQAVQQQQQHHQQPGQDLGRQHKLADVDWSRYHLQVLFIDRHDQLRARLAAGLFERVAEWNGFGRALYPWTCGTHVDGSAAGRAEAMWKASSLLSQAMMLGISPKVITRSPEAFDLRDLDAYDVVVAVDTQTRNEVLACVDPKYLAYYRDKVHLLSDYAQQQPLTDAEVLRKGGLALLPRSMSQQLQQDLTELRGVVNIERPCLSDASPQGIATWNKTVLAVMLGCAGLVRYLIDAYPDDLPEYDPL